MQRLPPGRDAPAPSCSTAHRDATDNPHRNFQCAFEEAELSPQPRFRGASEDISLGTFRHVLNPALGYLQNRTKLCKKKLFSTSNFFSSSSYSSGFPLFGGRGRFNCCLFTHGKISINHYFIKRYTSISVYTVPLSGRPGREELSFIHKFVSA